MSYPNLYPAIQSTILFLLSLALPVAGDAPTLGRLSFWVHPEKMADFEAAYQQHLVPILQQHKLVEWPEQPTTIDGIFSRIFSFETPLEVADKA